VYGNNAIFGSEGCQIQPLVPAKNQRNIDAEFLGFLIIQGSQVQAFQARIDALARRVRSH
jgi:hypothetical protein